jgi:DNA-directed RNA polymerase specialized sigma24 family protein
VSSPPIPSWQPEPGSDFFAWIKAIARNLALNERKRWFRHHSFKDNFQAEIESCLDPLVIGFADRFEGDVFGALRECLSGLEEHARQVTEDFYFKGISTEQIGRQMERKTGWVRLVLFRSRAALARCLESKGVS